MRFLTLPSLVFLIVFCFPFMVSQICQRLNPAPFQRCINVGYNYTAYFPMNNTLHANVIKKLLERIGRQFEQCSEYSDLIVCSIFVPKCVEGKHSPVLPCRDVCEEFATHCQEKLKHSDRLEWIKGLCRLLPLKHDGADSEEQCFEPENYKPRYNKTTPIIQTCTDLSMSSCSDMGYNYTTQSKDSQMIFNSVLKSSLLINSGNDPLCSPILKKMFCSEFAPPCFPEDATEIVIRTVCKSDCEELARQCPDLYETHFGAFSYCEQMATEKSTDLPGFCQLTKWPTADRWSQRLTAKATTQRPTPPATSPSSVVPSSPSAGSAIPSTSPLRVNASLVISSVLLFVFIVVSVTVVTFVMQRKGILEGCGLRGYRYHVNVCREATLSLKALPDQQAA